MNRLSNSCVRLSLGLLICIGIFACSSVDANHGVRDACSDSLAEPMQVYDFVKGTQALVSVGITAYGSGDTKAIILSGMEEDLSAQGGNRGRTPKIIQVGKGEISPPPVSDEETPIELPVPVSLPSGHWGVLWVDVEPNRPHRGEVPSSFYLRRLWFAEYNGSNWEPARLLLTTPRFGMDWDAHHTIRYSRTGEPMIMVVARTDSVFSNKIMFGGVQSELRPVPVDPKVSVIGATFTIDSSGTVLVVASVQSNDIGRQLLFLTSSDGGINWSLPETIPETTDPGDRLSLQVDSQQGIHLLIWNGNSDAMKHLVLPFGSKEWTKYSLASPRGVTMRWANGIDRCGRLVIIREVMRSPTELLVLEKSHWRDGIGWTPFERVYPGYFGMHLFNGVTPDGEWLTGWTGDRVPVNEVAPVLDLKVWMVAQ